MAASEEARVFPSAARATASQEATMSRSRHRPKHSLHSNAADQIRQKLRANRARVRVLLERGDEVLPVPPPVDWWSLS